MILGGFGFLSRLHGLSIDNLVEVEMVLADGRIVIASENQYPGAPPFSAANVVRSLIPFSRPLVGPARCWTLPWRSNSL